MLQYQLIVDENTNEIMINIVPNKTIKPGTMNEIKEKISKLIDYSMDIKIELVEEIPFEKHGKTKTLVIKK